MRGADGTYEAEVIPVAIGHGLVPELRLPAFSLLAGFVIGRLLEPR